MKRIIIGLCAATAIAACGGTPPFGAEEGDADTGAGSVYLTDNNDALTLNNVVYDEQSDTLTINNIPFDDPDNVYQRITTESFNNQFDAYQSAPTPGSNEFQYFAVFRRSDSGQSQVTAAGTDTYIDFGYGGAGAQRLGNQPNLPSSGIYSYNGEYAAVRTSQSQGVGSDVVEYVTGDAVLRVDFDDFDETGAVGGSIGNRQLYNNAGVSMGALDGFISLQDTDIDFENGTIVSANAREIVAGD